ALSSKEINVGCNKRPGPVSSLSILLLLLAAGAQAAVNAVPANVSAFPGQTTQQITVDLTYPPSNGGTGVLKLSGVPSGTTTSPANVTYPSPAGSASSSTSFAFVVGTSTPPGTYTVL